MNTASSDAALTDAWPWDEMIAEFRSLGGTADNVVQRAGQYGYGLFPIDPSKPVDIHVPANLLVPTKWVREDGTDLIVEEASGLSADARRFFTRYQRAFSWGRDGRQSALSWFEQMENLPGSVRCYLRERMGMLLPDRFGEDQALLRYVVTRRISYRDELCLIPVAELINHSPHAPVFGTREGIRVRGVFADEVLACYSRSDSFRRFFEYGFTSDEKLAFSFPMTLPGAFGSALIVRGNTSEMLGTSGIPSLLPKVDNAEGGIAISHALLGDGLRPRFPRSIFRKVFRQFGSEQADEVFQRIVAYNIRVLAGLLEALGAHDSPVCRQLRAAAIFQLSSLSESYGVIDLDTLPAMPVQGMTGR